MNANVNDNRVFEWFDFTSVVDNINMIENIVLKRLKKLILFEIERLNDFTSDELKFELKCIFLRCLKMKKQ